MSSKLTVRTAEPPFDAPTVEFLDDVFERSGGRSYWDWKYRDSPAGAIPSAVALDGDRVIGHLGMIALPFKIEDTRVVAAIPSDFAIHEDYRARSLGADGLLSRLHVEAFRQLKGRADFAYMIPISGFYALARRYLKYSPLQEVGTLERDLGFVPALTRRGIRGRIARTIARPLRRFRMPSLPASAGVQVQEIGHDELSPELDDLSKCLTNSARVGVERHRDFLNWRYLASPDPARFLQAEVAGQVRGYLAWRIVTINEYRFCRVLDLGYHPDEEHVADALIASLVQRLARFDCDVLQTWCSPSDPTSSLWKRLGLHAADNRVRTLIHPHTLPEHHARTVSTQENWCFSMGDADGS